MAAPPPPAVQLYNWSGQPCGGIGQHPCSAGATWISKCGGDRQRSCNQSEWAENQPYVAPDFVNGAWNPNTPGGQAWGAAVAATGKDLDELGYLNNQAMLGLGPPIPGFGPDGQPLMVAPGLSPLGLAAGGLAAGAVLSAFVGYPWYYGGLLGAGGGYLYGLSRG